MSFEMPTCSHCRRSDARNYCGRCKIAFYCGSECQISHWTIHEPNCIANGQPQDIQHDSTGFTFDECGNESVSDLENDEEEDTSYSSYERIDSDDDSKCSRNYSEYDSDANSDENDGIHDAETFDAMGHESLDGDVSNSLENLPEFFRASNLQDLSPIVNDISTFGSAFSGPRFFGGDADSVCNPDGVVPSAHSLAAFEAVTVLYLNLVTNLTPISHTVIIDSRFNAVLQNPMVTLKRESFSLFRDSKDTDKKDIESMGKSKRIDGSAVVSPGLDFSGASMDDITSLLNDSTAISLSRPVKLDIRYVDFMALFKNGAEYLSVDDFAVFRGLCQSESQVPGCTISSHHATRQENSLVLLWDGVSSDVNSSISPSSVVDIHNGYMSTTADGKPKPSHHDHAAQWNASTIPQTAVTQRADVAYKNQNQRKQQQQQQQHHHHQQQQLKNSPTLMVPSSIPPSQDVKRLLFQQHLQTQQVPFHVDVIHEANSCPCDGSAVNARIMVHETLFHIFSAYFGSTAAASRIDMNSDVRLKWYFIRGSRLSSQPGLSIDFIEDLRSTGASFIDPGVGYGALEMQLQDLVNDCRQEIALMPQALREKRIVVFVSGDRDLAAAVQAIAQLRAHVMLVYDPTKVGAAFTGLVPKRFSLGVWPLIMRAAHQALEAKPAPLDGGFFPGHMGAVGGLGRLGGVGSIGAQINEHIESMMAAPSGAVGPARLLVGRTNIAESFDRGAFHPNNERPLTVFDGGSTGPYLPHGAFRSPQSVLNPHREHSTIGIGEGHYFLPDMSPHTAAGRTVTDTLTQAPSPQLPFSLGYATAPAVSCRMCFRRDCRNGSLCQVQVSLDHNYRERQHHPTATLPQYRVGPGSMPSLPVHGTVYGHAPAQGWGQGYGGGRMGR